MWGATLQFESTTPLVGSTRRYEKGFDQPSSLATTLQMSSPLPDLISTADEPNKEFFGFDYYDKKKILDTLDDIFTEGEKYAFELENDIKKRMRRNRDNKDFVPYTWLSDLMEECRVLKVLEEANVEEWKRSMITPTIRSSALRVFGTLVLMKVPHLICRFVESEATSLPMGVEAVQDAMGKSDFTGRLKDISHELEKRGKTERDEKEIRALEAWLAPIDDWAKTFVDKQFVFLSPDFSQPRTHRMILANRPLPFLGPDTNRGGSGSDGAAGHFGEVFKERLPPPIYTDSDDDDGKGSSQQSNLVRKQLKLKGISEYRDEERCLRLLNVITHPNILEILGSYTYSGAHNFLFPVANLGDLHDLLENEPPPAFRKEAAGVAQVSPTPPQIKEEPFYEAVCGLASALEKLHFYSNDDLKLKLIGCHHDLKPRNVLVHDDNFILADFGLSTLKDSLEDPNTMAPNRDPYFDSPESEDYQTLEKYPIGPPSDVWSFGCILAVILAYMKGGPQGVRDFKAQRVYTFPAYRGHDFIVKGFHAGSGKVNPNVVKWLNDRGAEAKADNKGAETDLVELIKDMLEVNPLARPEIRQVLRRLRCIALRKIAEPVLEAFRTSPHCDALEFSIEKHILSLWLDRIGPIAKLPEAQILGSDESYTQLRRALHDIGDELQLLSNIQRNDRPLFTRLRHSNELLLASVSWNVQISIHERVRLEILHQEPSARKLDVPVHADAQQPVSEEPLAASSLNYATRAAIANMTTLMGKPNNSGIPKLSQDDVRPLPLKIGHRGVPTFRLAKMAESADSAAAKRDVIIEEMQYGRNVADVAVARTLFDRMVHILGEQNRPAANFRALRCRGFYHDMSHRYFGVVYDYPSTPPGKTAVFQLAELIDREPDVVSSPRDLVIALDDRYRLAYDLAAAIYAFHQVGWLHKHISSYNILFFREDDQDKQGGDAPSTTSNYAPFTRLSLASPYMIGFSHARPNEAGQYSNRTSASAGDVATRTLRNYQHPDYLGDGRDERRSPYRSAYDYYSLGLVLLEIGYWRPLRDLIQTDESDRAKRAKHLRARRVPGLAAHMGDTYMAAVAACLDDQALYGDGSDNSKGGGDLDFERLVVDRNFEQLVLTPLESLRRRGVQQ
ncbi:hypothetical protein DL765_001159 [Monosporascus sp. GIB2]|nr:hypothetical protein DL765_001159 [Monosporascus sp. GIB2]